MVESIFKDHFSFIMMKITEFKNLLNKFKYPLYFGNIRRKFSGEIRSINKQVGSAITPGSIVANQFMFRRSEWTILYPSAAKNGSPWSYWFNIGFSNFRWICGSRPNSEIFKGVGVIWTVIWINYLLMKSWRSPTSMSPILNLEKLTATLKIISFKTFFFILNFGTWRISKLQIKYELASKVF